MVLRLMIALNFMLGAMQTVGSGNPSTTARVLELAFGLDGACLVVGFLTPLASASAVMLVLMIVLSLAPTADWTKHLGTIGMINLAVASLSLVLMGPGSFSLDARLFGRREIIIPENRSRFER